MQTVTCFSPDPESAIDVLAFVLCPAQVFVPCKDPEELAEIRRAMRPMKAAACRRWKKASKRRNWN